MPIQEFSDQRRHDRWFHLTGKYSNKSRILLSIHWVRRKTEYLQMLIDELNEDITIDVAEVSRLEA